MKICIFAYNFRHKKTQQGLYKLFVNGIIPDYAILADPIPLNFPHSSVRVGVKDMIYQQPSTICQVLGVNYIVLPHNSTQCQKFLVENNFDLGIILGARILKPFIINKFKVGILNLHPAVLPDNRGLDNIKWAVLMGMKQGATSHLIDSSIDRGLLIQKRTIQVYPEDSFTDIFLRVQNLQQQLMISAVNKMNAGFNPSQKLQHGTYFKSMSIQNQKKMLEIFEDYKLNYWSLK